MAPGFSKEEGQEEDVRVLPLRQWNTTTVFIRVPLNTSKRSPLYTSKPQWRFPCLLCWRAQLQLEERTSWSSQIGSDLREPIVQLVLYSKYSSAWEDVQLRARQDPQGSPSIQPGRKSRLITGLKVILNIHWGSFPTSESLWNAFRCPSSIDPDWCSPSLKSLIWKRRLHPFTLELDTLLPAQCVGYRSGASLRALHVSWRPQVNVWPSSRYDLTDHSNTPSQSHRPP